MIAAREELHDGFALRTLLERTSATAMQATPATWRLLLEAGFRAPPAFRMLCGGEALPRELANELLKGGSELWNLYGPTETTIWSSCRRMTAGDAPVTVGRAIANTQLYVLDHNDQLLPDGVPGQLHIGGAGVARGYHGQSELTQQKFPPNPFAPGRMYRTGDRARWLPGGELQLLGRSDLQVKLRGFRIELGEIESALARIAGITGAAVTLREDVPGAPRLVAYYAEAAGASLSEAALREALVSQIPDYMIPSVWMRLAQLPLSPHGKLDRAALPKPERVAADAEFTAPRPPELCLARIWAEVLHLPRVGANMDLLRLGADSIQLFQIIARSTREGFRLTARQLLQHRTLRAAASLIDEAAASASASEARAENRDLVLDRARVLHRIPLERSPRLGHEGIERDGHTADASAARAGAFENLGDEVRDREHVFVALLGQTDHEIKFEIADALAEHHFGGVQNLGLGKVLVDDLAHPLAAGFGSHRHALTSAACQRGRERGRDAIGLQGRRR